jgi:hypothetical protein
MNGSPVAGNTAEGIVPPLRSSHIAPTVANNERPASSFQNRRGRTTPRE